MSEIPFESRADAADRLEEAIRAARAKSGGTDRDTEPRVGLTIAKAEQLVQLLRTAPKVAVIEVD